MIFQKHLEGLGLKNEWDIQNLRKKLKFLFEKNNSLLMYKKKGDPIEMCVYMHQAFMKNKQQVGRVLFYGTVYLIFRSVDEMVFVNAWL